jgi:hypothetical protein
MNEHLNSIFELILPDIEKAKIKYWVYGGISVAGIKKEFIRKNDDVDIFVLNESYCKTLDVIEDTRINLGWRKEDSVHNKRSKGSYFSPGIKNDIFSVIPVYRENVKIKFVSSTNSIYFPEDFLDSIRRSVGTYNFFTPKNEYIKDLFIFNLKHLFNNYKDGKNKLQRRKDLRDKYIVDAQVILGKKEINKYFEDCF